MAKRSLFFILLCLGLLSNSWSCSSPADVTVSRAAPASTPASLAASSPATQLTPDKPKRAEQIEKIWPCEFEFDSELISEKLDTNRSYKISAEIPQIRNARTPATRKFNRWMRRKILGYVAEFRQLQRVAGISDKRKKLPPLHITESLELDYRVYYSDNRLLSLRLTHTVMAVGQMHPIDYYETINYDLNKGRLLRPADIFKRGYLRSLSDNARRELREMYDLSYSNDDWVKEGTRPIHDNFANWNIVPEGVLISFADYQVAAHAFGKPEMIIPYSALSRVVKGNSPIKEFVR